MMTSVMRGQKTNTPPDDISLRIGPLVNTAPILQSLGCQPEPVFRLAGLSMDEFGYPDRKIPYLQASRLLAACVKSTSCEYFGLLLGKASVLSHLGLAGFLARTAADVDEALHALTHNLDLHDEGGFSLLEKDPNACLLGYIVNQQGVEAIEQIYDLAVAICFGVMRALCGKNWSPIKVMISRRTPRDEAPYDQYFRCPIRYNAETTGIVFSSQLLAKHVPSSDVLLFQHLEQEANELRRLKQLQLVETIPMHLRRGLLRGDWSAQRIAADIGLHERSLHRRLSAAGTSYRHELDKARHLLSLQLLEGTDLSVTHIAYSCGYASSSAFIRAFSRWAGITPMEKRRTRPCPDYEAGGGTRR